MEIPATLPALVDQFPDDEACWAYLKQVRWPQGFVCPRCEGRRASFLEARRLWQCRTCRRQVSLTAGTVLQGTRIPLRKWFPAIFFVARHKQGISALQLQQDLGLGSYQTAWTMCSTSSAPGSHGAPTRSSAGTLKPTRRMWEALAAAGSGAEEPRTSP